MQNSVRQAHALKLKLYALFVYANSSSCEDSQVTCFIACVHSFLITFIVFVTEGKCLSMVCFMYVKEGVMSVGINSMFANSHSQHKVEMGRLHGYHWFFIFMPWSVQKFGFLH